MFGPSGNTKSRCVETWGPRGFASDATLGPSEIYPNRRAVSTTMSRVRPRTPERLFKTRSTVAVETPASRATSFKVERMFSNIRGHVAFSAVTARSETARKATTKMRRLKFLHHVGRRILVRQLHYHSTLRLMMQEEADVWTLQRASDGI